VTSLEIIRLIAPELSGVSDEDLTKFIDMMDDYFSSQICGGNRDRLIAYAAAHYATLIQQSESGATSGAVVGESEGSVSRSYGTFGWSNPSRWDRTTYGIEVKQMLDACIVMPTNRMVKRF